MSDSGSIPYPAATVVLLRDGADGCEVLLVRRNAQLAFHGGAWVFPGGRIDPADFAAAGAAEDVFRAARWAAAREAMEEAGVRVDPEALLPLSRWVTPVNLPRRFDTWFFVGGAGDETVRVDGGEIHDHAWLSPARALAAQQAGEIELPPPTFVTLTQLAPAASCAEALRRVAQGAFESFEPELHLFPGGACALYEGDAALGGGDLDRPGPRHRLRMEQGSWIYERTTAAGGPP